MNKPWQCLAPGQCVQVGIIALNLIGEPLRSAPEGPPGFLDTEGPVSHDLPYYNRAAGELADLQLDVHVDTATAARIKVCQAVQASWQAHQQHLAQAAGTTPCSSRPPHGCVRLLRVAGPGHRRAVQCSCAMQ